MYKQLRKSEIKEINEELDKWNISLNKKDKIELVEEENKLIIVNDEISFFYYDNKIVPSLKLLLKNNLLKKVTVDMGAIKFVVSGADIMGPGIVKVDENIQKEDFVSIVDEKNNKALAVGIALEDSENLQGSGKKIRNIHYIGDKIWS